nr:interleukin 26 [Lateolabrax maculatus]
MFLLLVRTSVLILLISLAGGLVAVATAERGITCRQEIPAELIRDLWSRTTQLINKLPKEEKFSGRVRLLPKFCTKCPERTIGWLEMRQLLDVYQRSVFSRELVQELLPLHYNDLLYRLQHTLQHCVSSSKPSKWFKIIKKLERKIKKRRRDVGALKAVGEFTFILRWIDELAQHHVL